MHSHLSSVPGEALPRWKRVLDIACCLAALPLLAVAAFWATLITTLRSPGPILFRQERVGLGGRRFLLYKFRTMHVTASPHAHQAHLTQLMKTNMPMQKLDARGDRRLIPGGWWLRVTGLDELPQIINVLRGDMSIVGPRPCIPYEFEHYSAAERRRLDSVPGLTGLWQVSGKNRTTFETMVRLDVAYGENKSLGGDLSIILRTVPAILTQIADMWLACRQAMGEPVKIDTAMPANLASQSTVSTTFLTQSHNAILGTPETKAPQASYPTATRPLAGRV
jgi:exopolysaccharide production protein ExoY